jgi:hypothetical protein
MYNVASRTQQQDFESLDLAMAHARTLGEFVTIIGNGMEIVGVFGADSIENGKCPDGVDYTWMKRRSQ